MTFNQSVQQFHKKHTHILFLIVVAAVSLLVFKAAGRLEHVFSTAMDGITYLAWHNIFEFASTLVCFSVFCVAYFTYNQSNRLRSIFIGCVFLAVGMVDAFHTLSFKGMPEFLTTNEGANKATVFWIIARLLSALGFLVMAFIPRHRKTRVNKLYFLIPALFVSILALLVVTYRIHWLPTMYDEVKGLTDIKIFLEWVIIALFFITVLKLVWEYRNDREWLLILMAGALVINIFSELAFVSYKNDVHHIYNYLGHIYKCIADFIIFRVIFIYNVQDPYKKLSEAQKELKEYAENLDRIVDKRTLELKTINQKLMDDLEYARDIQKAILPTRLPDERGVSFTARYFPAESVGGDFYNIFKIGEDHIGMYIGDVAGHGVPAAMLTVFMNQGINTIKDMHGEHAEIVFPSVVLSHLYDSFNKTNFREHIYAVLLYAVYNIKTGKLIYASAGMNAAPVLIKGSGQVRELETIGLPICKLIDYYRPEYTDQVVQLDKGDKILFFTDGLFEAGRGEEDNSRWFKDLLVSCSEMTSMEMTDKITSHVEQYMENLRIKDDITFFIMKVEDNAP